MPRPPKSSTILAIEGKAHKTKEELKFRKEQEQSLMSGERFQEIDEVKNNIIAHKEFLRLQKLYENIDFVDALDQQIINRYCLEFANIIGLEERIEKLDDDLENAEEFKDRLSIYKIQQSIQQSMNKSKEFLLKYEDRLFLNPISRMKAIPKKPQKEEKPSGIAAYRAKRAEK